LANVCNAKVLQLVVTLQCTSALPLKHSQPTSGGD